MYAGDLERQLTRPCLYDDAMPYVYRQGFLLGHPHINLCSASSRAAPKLVKIILSYAHTNFAVLLAAAAALDTAGTVEAKR